MFGVELSEKEERFVRNMYKRMSDESYAKVSDEDKLHRLFLHCFGENTKKPWTEEEIEMVRTSKLSPGALARKLGRTYQSVYDMRGRIHGKQW